MQLVLFFHSFYPRALDTIDCKMHVFLSQEIKFCCETMMGGHTSLLLVSNLFHLFQEIWQFLLPALTLVCARQYHASYIVSKQYSFIFLKIFFFLWMHKAFGYYFARKYRSVVIYFFTNIKYPPFLSVSIALLFASTFCFSARSQYNHLKTF